MTLNQTRTALLSIFVGSLAMQLTALIAVKQKMWPEEFEQLALKLLGVYSVQLSVMLGGMFAQPRLKSRAAPTGVAWAAILLSIFWNSLLVWRSISFSIADEDSATNLLKYLDIIASGSSFLVAGALAFFFSKSATPETSR